MSAWTSASTTSGVTSRRRSISAPCASSKGCRARARSGALVVIDGTRVSMPAYCLLGSRHSSGASRLARCSEEQGLRHWRDVAPTLYDAGNERVPEEVRMTSRLSRRAVLAAPLAAMAVPARAQDGYPKAPVKSSSPRRPAGRPTSWHA